MYHHRLAALAIWVQASCLLADETTLPWPPELPGAVHGTATFSSPELVKVPSFTGTAAKQPAMNDFAVAAKPPVVDLAFHRDLGPDAASRRLWSSWGDIGVASDGRVYCAIGDHASDAGGDARCFVYCWDPTKKTLTQVVDMNRVVPPKNGRPAWSKVHAKLDEGPDGKIYFSCTLNAGQRASQPQFHWDEELPGGQLYQYDPATGKTTIVANLPPKRCTATSRLDRARNVWWCNLEGGEGEALFAIDLETRKPLYRGDEGSVGFNRAFALTKDGSIYFNGLERLMKLDVSTRHIEPTKTTFGDSPGMRCASRESSDHCIYGVTHKTNELFRYSIAKDELTLLGPVTLGGGYTTVMELSPDEKYLYYLPGSHGKAYEWGTPIVRYEIANGQRTVVAFLAPYCEKAFGYVPAGTYGMKLSADGRTIYVNFNGHPAPGAPRPKHLKTSGFGLTSFAAIHLPAE